MTGNGGDDGDKMTNLTSGLSIQSVIPFSMAKNGKLPTWPSKFYYRYDDGYGQNEKSWQVDVLLPPLSGQNNVLVLISMTLIAVLREPEVQSADQGAVDQPYSCEEVI